MSTSECYIPSAFQKRNARHVRRLVSTVSAVALAIATTVPAWAGGSNTSIPNPPPTTPPAVTPSTDQKTDPGTAICAQQYTDQLNNLAEGALINDGLGLGNQTLGATAQVANLIVQTVASSADTANFLAIAPIILADVPLLGTASPASVFFEALAADSLAKSIAFGTAVGGAVSTVSGLGFSTAALGLSIQQHILAEEASGLPFCDVEFIGTVKVSNGGINVTGASIFNDDVGVVGDVDVGGNVTASQVHATQGISAMGGKITLGDLDGIHYWKAPCLWASSV